MKKLIISFFITFMSLFFIWFVIGYVRYGSNIFNMHLDLYSTFKLVLSMTIDNSQYQDFILNIDSQINSNLPDWLSYINVIIKPMYFIAYIIMIIYNIFTIIINFIFNPIFI